MTRVKTLSRAFGSALVSIALAASATITAPQAHAGAPTTAPTGDLAKAIVHIDMPTSTCSGAMISPSWALTARHCVEDPDGSNRLGTVNRVTIGDKPSRSRMYAGTVHAHPSTDLALININGVYNGPTLPLAQSRVNYDDILTGAGFGHSNRQATIYKLTNNRHHDSDLRLDRFLINGYRITHDAVQSWEPATGDSGSPILNDAGEIVAVFSSGQIKSGTRSTFERASNPDITRYSGWITATAGLGNTSAGATDSGPSDVSRGGGGFVSDLVSTGTSGGGSGSSSAASFGIMAIISLMLGTLASRIFAMAPRLM